MVGTVIREAFGLYRSLFRQLVPVTLLVFVPFTIALIVLEIAVPDSSSARRGLAIIDAVGSLLLFAPLASIVAIRAGSAQERGGRPAIRAAVGTAFGLLVPYVATQVLVLLLIAALPGALIAAGYAAGSSLLVTLGIGVLLGSALLNGVRLTVATVAVAVEDARYGSALRRSAALTRGAWLATFGVIVVVTACAFIASAALSTIALPFPAGVAQDVAGSVVELLANAVAVPFVALASYRLYRTLEDRAQARRAA